MASVVRFGFKNYLTTESVRRFGFENDLQAGQVVRFGMTNYLAASVGTVRFGFRTPFMCVARFGFRNYLATKLPLTRGLTLPPEAGTIPSIFGFMNTIVQGSVVRFGIRADLNSATGAVRFGMRNSIKTGQSGMVRMALTNSLVDTGTLGLGAVNEIIVKRVGEP